MESGLAGPIAPKPVHCPHSGRTPCAGACIACRIDDAFEDLVILVIPIARIFAQNRPVTIHYTASHRLRQEPGLVQFCDHVIPVESRIVSYPMNRSGVVCTCRQCHATASILTVSGRACTRAGSNPTRRRTCSPLTTLQSPLSFPATLAGSLIPRILSR